MVFFPSHFSQSTEWTFIQIQALGKLKNKMSFYILNVYSSTVSVIKKKRSRSKIIVNLGIIIAHVVT